MDRFLVGGSRTSTLVILGDNLNGRIGGTGGVFVNLITGSSGLLLIGGFINNGLLFFPGGLLYHNRLFFLEACAPRRAKSL